MQRRHFVQTTLITLPLAACAAGKEPAVERTDQGFSVTAGETRFGESYLMKGVTLNRLDPKISGRDTGNGMAVFEQTGLTPNGGPPLHIHPRQDEWFYVLAGDYRFQVGSDRFSLGAGDTIFLPRQVPHAFIQLSERGKMLVAYQPAGKMEAFFRTTSQWTTPPSSELVARVFAQHDMEVVGPPLARD